MSELIKKIRNWGVVVGISAAIAVTGYSYFIPDTIRTKVIETQVKRYDNHDKYLVFTDDGVFENTDARYRFKFRSSDLQGKLMKLRGKDVDITKYGWRFGPTSLYENIVAVDEVKPEKK
jgi:hypothetical protein